VSAALDAAVGSVWRALGGPSPGGAPHVPVRWSESAGGLDARLPVSTVAGATVACCALAAAELGARRGYQVPRVAVDSGSVGTAFTSERHLRRDGQAFPTFAPLSRFWPAADGWVRTHANYAHHRERLLRLLGIAQDGATLAGVGAAIAGWPAGELEEAAAGAGALAFAVRTPAQWLAHEQGAAVAGLPLLSLRRVGDAPARSLPAAPESPMVPAAGLRVLDLTRVIAGPVATRTLALLGADVLRVDPPGLPEIEAQHLDTGFGKRTALLDLASAAGQSTLDDLVAGADVVVTGYRPGGMDRFGLAPEALLERRPGLVVARLSAWSTVGPWADRRGFDSLVQAATGIAIAERPPGTEAPGALPAQALDHGTGYLLAAAVLRALSERVRTGGGWLAELSLAQTAHWLQHGGLHASGAPAAPIAGGDGWLAEAGGFRYALPPVRLPGAPRTWAHPPHGFGTDAPAWLAEH
jgi:hypothetical protein